MNIYVSFAAPNGVGGPVSFTPMGGGRPILIYFLRKI